MTKERLYLFDTTLRDGQQTPRLARRRTGAEERHGVMNSRAHSED
jgi:hypothetical protein